MKKLKIIASMICASTLIFTPMHTQANSVKATNSVNNLPSISEFMPYASYSYTGYINAERVNLRDSNLNYIGTVTYPDQLEYNTSGYIIDKKGTFYPVKMKSGDCRNMEGYVEGSFIT